MNEFAQYRSWLFDAGNNENEVNRILHTFPKGARIVHRKLVKWGEVRVDDMVRKSFANSSNGQQQPCDIVGKVSFGIPREPDDFVQQALKAGHPRFLDFRSIRAIDELLSFNLQGDSSKILERRAAWLYKEMDQACKGACGRRTGLTQQSTSSLCNCVGRETIVVVWRNAK